MYKFIFSNGFIVNLDGHGCDLDYLEMVANHLYQVSFHNYDNWIVRIIQDDAIIFQDSDFDFNLLEGLI